MALRSGGPGTEGSDGGDCPAKPFPPAAASGYADPSFSTAVIHWQQQHGRHTLPWQGTRDPYRVWLSEIMLQQTQVAAVIPYYQRFLEQFPSVAALAAAPTDEVMALWAGLGYYSRARNLHQCARQVVARHGGAFPADPALLADLPGIGRSTAAAVAAFSYGVRAAILDGNVKRVFARVFGIEAYPGEKAVETQLWLRAEALLPMDGIGPYTQGLMDLGATVCSRSRPTCGTCPLATRCVALATGRVDALPVRKPSKVKPEKHAVMLVLLHQGQVLLEKRPPSGIWGGLLSLPEVDGQRIGGAAHLGPGLDEAALQRAVVPFGEPESWSPLEGFSHVFTHYRLHVAPWRVTLARRLDRVGQSEHVWLGGEELARAALPAPVKKFLLEQFGLPGE